MKKAIKIIISGFAGSLLCVYPAFADDFEISGYIKKIHANNTSNQCFIVMAPKEGMVQYKGRWLCNSLSGQNLLNIAVTGMSDGSKMMVTFRGKNSSDNIWRDIIAVKRMTNDEPWE